MNNKGFISISVIYSFFVVFLMLLLFIVDGYVNNRTLIKKISKVITDDAIGVTFCETHFREKVCSLYPDYDPNTSNHDLLYHNNNLPNGAGDNSYRYVGANPNNYVCFGSDAAVCPAENLYRIIGIVPVTVITRERTDTLPELTEVQSLYKLIKNDYATPSNLSITSDGEAGKNTNYAGPSGNQPGGSVAGFYAGSELNKEFNTWNESYLVTTGLNTNYLNNIGSSWSNIIEKVYWSVGGNLWSSIADTLPLSTVFHNEIEVPINNNSLDGRLVSAKKVNLLYVTDYAYAVPSANWNTKLNVYHTVAANNWLYRGVMEWTGTRVADNSTNQFRIGHAGEIVNTNVKTAAGARPVFYLKDIIKIVTTGHNGTASDPYRLQ